MSDEYHSEPLQTVKPSPLLMVLAAWLLLIITITIPLTAQQNGATMTVKGNVRQAQTAEPIPGAVVRVQSLKKGAIVLPNGTFTMTLPKGRAGERYTVRISAINYQPLEFTIAADSLQTAPLVIQMKSSSVLLANVEVVAELSPRTIVQRAVKRIEEQRKNLRTFTALVYRKNNMTIDADVIGISDYQRERNHYSITESFERIYSQYQPDRLNHMVLLQRRQSANASDRKIPLLEEVCDLTADELQFMTTHLKLPLGAGSMDSYTYNLRGREDYQGDTVFVIDFQPASRIFPGFRGTMEIAEDDYTVRTIHLQLTERSTIPFFKTLAINQEFKPFWDKKTGVEFWLPVRQDARTEANIELVKWIAELGATIATTSVLNDVRVNVSIPDSLLKPIQYVDPNRDEVAAGKPNPNQVTKRQDGFLTVAADADSIKDEYWSDTKLRQLTTQDSIIYARADSLSRELTAAQNAREGVFNTISRFNLGDDATVWLNPVWNPTRVTGALYGADATLFWHNTSINGNFGISLQGAKTAALSIKHDLLRTKQESLTLFGYAFSRMAQVQEQPVISRSLVLMSGGVNLTNLFYSDFSDFYREDGFTAGIAGRVGDWGFGLAPRISHHTPLQTLYSDRRYNVPAYEGSFRTVQGELSWNYPFITVALPIAGEKTDLGFRMTGVYGEEKMTNLTFYRTEISGRLVQPTFHTGYTPMYLAINATVGLASDNTPVQSRFVMQRRLPFMGLFNDFSTTDINLYGGTRYVMVQAEHGFSDVLWRWLGLPTFEGRGVELIARAATARYDLPVAPPAEGMLMPTNGWYSEVGLGVSRIPTFISDAIYARVDVMFGVGNRAAGRFGVNLAVSLPVELLALVGIFQQ